MWSQLARLKLIRQLLHFEFLDKRSVMDMKCSVPTKSLLDEAREELKKLGPSNKHWSCGANNSVTIAAALLEQNEVIAIPTETVYGLACYANSDDAIRKLYDIKKRDGNKPLSICVSSVKYIKRWSYVDHIPDNLLESIFPGPYTVILPRRNTLNPALNPGCNTVGVRVPEPAFVRNVAALAEPLALTSANLSNEPSTTTPDEFSDLWPQLGGIFHDKMLIHQMQIKRTGSTIVDLTKATEFRIVREGVGNDSLIKLLRAYGLEHID